MRATMACLLLVAGVSLGQTTGTPPFGSFSGDADVIDNANLNVHWNIPIFSRAGRGLAFSYTLTYDSLVYSPQANAWAPAPDWGWGVITQPVIGSFTYETATQSCQDQGSTYYYTQDSNFVYTDSFGTPHSVYGWVTQANGAPCATSQRVSGGTMDGSGIAVNVNLFPYITITLRSGASISTYATESGAPQTDATAMDSNGNEITFHNSSGSFTDTLGTTALTVGGSASPSGTRTYSYTNPGGSQSEYKVNFGSYNVATKFACSGISNYTGASQPLVSSISLPDGTSYKFTYEPTPGQSNYVTGRIASITIPTGGTITYTYSGVNCADGSPLSVTRTTPDGTWTYSRTLGSGAASTTTVTDPAQNQTVIQFQGIYETRRQAYQGSAKNGTLLQTIDTCYSGSPAPCVSTPVALPITQVLSQVAIPVGTQGSTKVAGSMTFYNSYGLPTEADAYDYGNGSLPSTPVSKSLTTYATLNGIYDHPSLAQVTSGSGTVLSQTSYTYTDTVTSTSDTPQHTSPAGSRGNVATITQQVSSKTGLTQSFTYFDTGNVQTSKDANGNVTTYNYADATSTCGNSFPTSISVPTTTASNPLVLTSSQAWNCVGGVVSSTTDANKAVTSVTNWDAHYWRATGTQDALGNKRTITYNTNSTETAMTFNGGNSTSDTLITLDGLGRTHLSQTRQGPNSQNWDSVETDYDSFGRAYRVSVPYTAGQGAGMPSGTATTVTAFDALGRPYTVTDGGQGKTTYSYNSNDVLVTIGPAPSGENTKSRQLEYDGLGRLTSVCEVTSGSGSVTCGQTSPIAGYWTKYSYDPAGNLLQITQNALGSTTQTRTLTYDWLGRELTEQNPENGKRTYVYDSETICGSSAGDQVKTIDNANNATCFSYDAMHRNTAVWYPSSSTAPQTFVYDSATVNGVTMANALGKLAEAYTGPASAKVTDTGMSYSLRGEVTDTWQSSLHSAGYYHSSAAYAANGVPSKMIPAPITVPTFTYGLDGEGRVNAVTASAGYKPASSITYGLFGVTGITYGSGDSDTFTYDPNTGRQLTYSLSVGGRADSGTLTWNANGTLQQLTINDDFWGQDSQTCVNAYDDLMRLVSNNCGSVWGQSFSYDVFGNLSKSGSSSFQATYTNPSTNVNNNQYFTLPNGSPSYDANGNVVKDGFHTYQWDANGNLIGNENSSIVRDAFGREVEVWGYEVVYGPDGSKQAYMNGQSLAQAFVYLPKGAMVQYDKNGTLDYYAHPDWLGTQRVYSSPQQGVYGDKQFAPYGEEYGAGGSAYAFFTGTADSMLDNGAIYNFPARDLHVKEGRWLSPDPAGFAAVDFTNPQTFNRYAYVMGNPLGYVDPTGTHWETGPDVVQCDQETVVVLGQTYVFPTGCVVYGTEVWVPDPTAPNGPTSTGGGEAGGVHRSLQPLFTSIRSEMRSKRLARSSSTR